MTRCKQWSQALYGVFKQNIFPGVADGVSLSSMIILGSLSLHEETSLHAETSVDT